MRFGPGFPARACLLTALLVAAAAGVDAATITVTTPADELTPNNGTVSLREAITALNLGNTLGDPDIIAQNPGAFGSSDAIHFNIPGGGVQTIALSSALPLIVKPMTIDGYTQPNAVPNSNGPGLGSNGTLLIRITAIGFSPGADSGVLTVYIGGGGTTIRGLVINSYNPAGIALVNSGGGNHIAGNYIGINAAGDAVGTGPSSAIGIEVRAFNGGVEQNDVIGGPTPADRNVIAGNNQSGQILLPSGTQAGTQIIGNFIGTNAAGTASLSIAGCVSSAQAGIRLDSGSTGTQIGNGSATGRNVIAGNCSRGVSIVNSGIVDTTISGNYVGTDVTGTTALGNQGEAIVVFGASGTTISDNVIAAAINTGSNAEGIDVTGAPSTQILGNHIGTDTSGTINLGNQGIGVSITNTSNMQINGNTIAFNGCCQLGGQPGIRINSGTGNTMNGNSIYSNTGGGILLGGSANNLQAAPTITGGFVTANQAVLSGTLTSVPSTSFRLEFFSSPVCDASGFGQGKSYLGNMTVTTNGAGTNTFGPFGFPLISGQPIVTATATNLATGDTSQFSACHSLRILDIDGNGFYDALTDGLLLIRYLEGITGAALTNGALGPGATRTTPGDVLAYLAASQSLLDIDGNQEVDVLSDGLLVLRYLFGLRGPALIDSALGNNPTRTTYQDIESYLITLTQ